MKNWITFPKREGDTSRQAHTNLPAGSYERELGKNGFFGPATEMYHSHPPTGWTRWEGDLRPRAFDLTKINSLSDSPWDAAAIVHNRAIRLRYWRLSGKMEISRAQCRWR